jgi:acetyl-CoA carboxylase biotin carboxyl carrier protein
MEFESIKELVKLFDKSSLSKLRVHKDDFSIDLEKAGSEVIYAQPVKMAPIQQATQEVAQPKPATQSAATEVKPGEIITSPMVGTFYKAPSPDSPPYAKVGEIVKKSKSMCIIEAMKIMNEIEAEFDCKILEIMVEDGQPVEYDMPLFRVEKI